MVRQGFRKVVLGLRLLEGRCVSLNEANFQHVEDGTRPLLHEDVEEAEKLLIEGLSKLEGTILLVCSIINNDNPIGVHPVNITI